MPFVERLKSFFQLQLDGWGPEELVSLGAELGVVACFVTPLVAFSFLARWLLRAKSQSHRSRQASVAPAEIHAPARTLSPLSHRS